MKGAIMSEYDFAIASGLIKRTGGKIQQRVRDEIRRRIEEKLEVPFNESWKSHLNLSVCSSSEVSLMLNRMMIIGKHSGLVSLITKKLMIHPLIKNRIVEFKNATEELNAFIEQINERYKMIVATPEGLAFRERISRLQKDCEIVKPVYFDHPAEFSEIWHGNYDIETVETRSAWRELVGGDPARYGELQKELATLNKEYNVFIDNIIVKDFKAQIQEKLEKFSRLMNGSFTQLEAMLKDTTLISRDIQFVVEAIPYNPQMRTDLEKIIKGYILQKSRNYDTKSTGCLGGQRRFQRIEKIPYIFLKLKSLQKVLFPNAPEEASPLSFMGIEDTASYVREVLGLGVRREGDGKGKAPEQAAPSVSVAAPEVVPGTSASAQKKTPPTSLSI